MKPPIHFEDGSTRPDVFRITRARSGAILDVFDPQPLPAGHSLWRVPNVYLSPHCSSDDNDDYMPMTLDLAFANAVRLARGRKLTNVVNPARGY